MRRQLCRLDGACRGGRRRRTKDSVVAARIGSASSRGAGLHCGTVFCLRRRRTMENGVIVALIMLRYERSAG